MISAKELKEQVDSYRTKYYYISWNEDTIDVKPNRLEDIKCLR